MKKCPTCGYEGDEKNCPSCDSPMEKMCEKCLEAESMCVCHMMADSPDEVEPEL